MKPIVELAAASLPWAIRDRYREEWLHDLQHAEEAGVRRADVAWAAVRTAITADRMQAPSVAHAVLQARLRIDVAGMHALLCMVLGFGSMTPAMLGQPVIAAILWAGALVHAVIALGQLQLASRLVGGALRFAPALLAVGMALAATSISSWSLAHAPWWMGWLGLAGAGCAVAGVTIAGALQPPKPAVLEHIRTAKRPNLLHAVWIIGVAVLAVGVLDAAVIVPASWTTDPTLDHPWAAVALAGGPASPFVAGLHRALVMLAPILFGCLGAARWARSERGMLGWAAGGALVATFAAGVHGIALSGMLPVTAEQSRSGMVVLPLLAAALMEVTARAQRDVAPLPGASVPLPPGPWHLPLGATALSNTAPGQAKGPGVEPGANRARGGT